MNLNGAIISLLILSLFLLAATSCTANTVVDEWSSYRHDASHTGTSSSDAPNNNLLWKFYTGSEIKSTAATADGIVYVSSNNGTLYALNAQTGALIWKYNWTGQTDSSPAVANGMVYVGYAWDGYAGYLDGFDATTGDHVWRVQNDAGGIISSPTVVNGVVYTSYYNGQVYAQNGATGSVIWSYTTSGELFSSPAVVNGAVYFGTLNGYLYALNAATGGVIWSFYAGNAVYASPAVEDNVVYVNSDNGALYALDALGGNELWRACFGTGDHADDSPAVAYGMVFVGSRNGYYAFNATNGHQIWFFTSPYSNRQYTGWVYSSPAVASGIVYFGSADNYLFALDAYTGDLIWSYKTGGYLFASPAIANGTLYIGSYDGYVYAFGGENNSFVNPTPTPIPNPTSTPTPTATTTLVPTATPTPSPTSSPTTKPTATPTPNPTATPTPYIYPTSTPNPIYTTPYPTSAPAYLNNSMQATENKSIDISILGAIAAISAVALMTLLRSKT